jgi:RNA polymerase sigma-70 factor (ECF subfamily)
MPDAPDDATLVRQARKGSEEAFRQIVVRHQNRVFALLVRIVRDRELAADLAQESFLKAYRFLDRFDTSRPLKSWLFKIAHNTALDHLRKSQLDTIALETREPDRLDPLDRVGDRHAVDPHASAESRDLGRDLEGAFAALGPLYQELLELRFREGLSYQEIADVTGLPMGTVKVRIHRGRQALAEHLGARGWLPE